MPADCCDIKKEEKCSSHFLSEICGWDEETKQCRNIHADSYKLFKQYDKTYYPCPPSSDTSQSDTSENN